MTANPFGFWENIHDNYLFFSSLKDSIEYNINFLFNYISDIEIFPEITIDKYLRENADNENNCFMFMSVAEMEFDMPSKYRFEADYMYVDASLYDTYTKRLHPYQQYKHRGWRSVEMTNYHNLNIPIFYDIYREIVPNINFPYWAFPGNIDMPVLIHTSRSDAFYNTHLNKTFHWWNVFVYMFYNGTYLNYITDSKYIFKDYIIQKSHVGDLVYSYDYMQTKISNIKMRNYIFPKSSYYNDSMNKRDFMHHDYKNSNLITTNYYKTSLKNSYFENIYGINNPLIWKEGNHHLMGFYLMYYDCFGSPEPIWLNQFSYALENVFHYFNKSYTKFTDAFEIIDIDSSMIHFKRGHPIIMYAHWFEWHKLEDDMLIFRKFLPKENRGSFGMGDMG